MLFIEMAGSSSDFLYVFIFLFGLIVGSFLNVVILRLASGQSFLHGRSECPSCKKKLTFFELIPVVSFIFLKGRCRRCRARISWQYPLVELTTGLLFLAASWRILTHLPFRWLLLEPFSFSSLLAIGFVIFWLFFVSSLIIIFVYDLRFYIIPDKVVFFSIALALIFNLFRDGFLKFGDKLFHNFQGLAIPFSFLSPQGSVFGNPGLFFVPAPWAATLSALLAAIFFFGFFLFLNLVSRGRWMGMGDVKFAFLIGLILGWPDTLLAAILAFIVGSLAGLILIIIRKKDFKSQIPFGPFLVIGVLMTMFWGQQILQGYFSLFGF